MSKIDKRALREAAEKATPGNWWIDSHGHSMVSFVGNDVLEVFTTDNKRVAVRHEDTGNLSRWRNDNDATFIATADPATVLVLLDELEAAEKRIAELESLMAPKLTQQALVVPDEMTPKQASRSYCGEVRGYRDDWNACRAAMLQGADVSLTHEGKNHHKDKLAMVDHSGDSNNMVEPVTTTYKLPFEQWLSKQTGIIDVECGCVMTEVFFNWLRAAYDAGNSPVIADGWVLVPEEPTHEMLEAGDEQFGTYDVYRRMIAAAPQQEVK